MLLLLLLLLALCKQNKSSNKVEFFFFFFLLLNNGSGNFDNGRPSHLDDVLTLCQLAKLLPNFGVQDVAEVDGHQCQAP